MKVYALDIGGSSIKHALINTNGGTPGISKRLDSLQLASKDFADLRDMLITATRDVLRNDSEISTVAISTTGNVDQHGTVRRAGHFNGYENVSWNQILKHEFPKISNVVAVNDGKASTWAEFWAVRDECTTFAHVVVGTGIGGGLVIDGVLFYGDQGSAGSFGHMKVGTHMDVQCSCTRKGCLETVASAPAIVRGFNEATKSGKASSLEEVIVLAQQGDAIALQSFIEAGRYLGVVLSDLMNVLNPQIITIGGGVVLAAQSINESRDENLFVSTAVESAKSLALVRVASATSIRVGRYGNDSGLIGAALLAAE
jgi:glucokinase